MAKRASLSFDAMKGTKVGGADSPSLTSPATTAPPKPPAAEKRGRGRPIKRDPESKIYGMTLRIPGHVRIALRRLAESETDKRGRIVSVHDVIIQAVESHLARKGFKAVSDE
ncbi:MAG: hypothetical protein CGW95_01645 [Phenylobacterium zucineum]|nr:MAG: hypothetical protein CGW95_01645 [Phenylobacterium zucineum]